VRFFAKKLIIAVGKSVSDLGVNDLSLITVIFVKKVASKLSVIFENNFIIETNAAVVNSFGLLSGRLRFDTRMHLI
jgi:hypothetical protein